jgi:hypothetical protein
LPLTRADFFGVLDRVLDVHEGAWLFGRVGVGDENRALLQEGPVALEDHVDRRIQKRMPWREQLRLHLPGRGHEFLLEGHARVTVDDRAVDTERATAGAYLCRNARDLVAARLTVCDLAAKQPKRLEEEGADEVRLELPRLRLLHALADRLHVRRGHHLRQEGPLLQRLLELLAHGRVDDLVELCLDLRLLAVTHGLDPEVAQR